MIKFFMETPDCLKGRDIIPTDASFNHPEVPMTRLVNVLYPLPDYRRTPLSLLWWWESRRLTYNLWVGAAGVVTLIGVTLVSGGRIPILSFPVLMVVCAYGLVANACFTLGWLSELAARALWGRDAPDLGPFLYREGLLFSVGLTVFPLFAALLFSFARVLLAIG
jgi:hypothetical protein